MKRYFLRIAVSILATLPAAIVRAEDIDLFTGVSSAGSIPNVLIILDNTANWSKPFNKEIAALASTIESLPIGSGDVPKFNVGLMMFSEAGEGNTGNDGAYVRSAIRPLNADYKSKLSSLIKSFKSTEDGGNGGKSSKAMMEAYLYFSGGAPYAGNYKNKSDYKDNNYKYKFGNDDISENSRSIWALSGNSLLSKGAVVYQSLPPSGCQNNTYIVYISNGPQNDSTNDIRPTIDKLVSMNADTSTIPLSPSTFQENTSDEWARFMHNSSLKTTVYTFDVDKDTKSNGPGPGWTALLKSMAGVSSGKYFDVSSDGSQIADALGLAFTEIQAVNSVFASVSLPVSVNTQGTYLNQVFVGMFRPDADGYPRWNGNLKQYKLGYTNGILGLLDADNKDAINTQTGFISECARSFWTPTIVDSYWSFQPNGNCLTISNSSKSNYPDGNIVEKGAQAYTLRSATSARKVYTCSPAFAACTSLTDFATSNAEITETLLGANTTYTKDDQIKWITGVDIIDEDRDDDLTEIRPSVHGDVVHSRPVAINFNTDAEPQVVVFYGANDGMLRAVNGNRTAAIGDAQAGSELWSFMPPEFYSNIKRLRANTPQISYPGVTGGAAKPYGIDGPITSVKSGTVTYLYAGMRRGGRALYAFDVSSPTSPKLKWKIGCPNLGNDTDCKSGFAQMGQTWSAAVSLKSSGHKSGNESVLMFGGGYDNCEDSDTSACSSPKGNIIFVVDLDGKLLKALPTDHGVVGDVVVAKGSDGLAKYAYAADLGGNVYRITIGTAAPASWTITKVASVGCSTVATCAQRRKFMFAPDVVEENGVYILLLGSGDREKPTSASTNAASVNNYFFMIKDKPSDSNWLSSENSTCGTDVICLDSLLAITTNTTPSSAALAGKKGWYLGLASSEQVVTTAITVLGTVTFSTFQRSSVAANSCSANLGTARVYNIAYTNAASKNGTAERGEKLPAGGLSPSPVAGKVTLDDGKTVIFVIGGSAASALQTKQPPTFSAGGAQPSKRVYWNVQK